ncbi:ZNF622 protein [Hibiscus syriacus]|uniref:ZNF622 protein n=1 Tax=Hibiscus syriacus TaxID=106335 RepID=A0A6A3CZY9_HIBSY|nr:ZNF622 protein [Hibiscus syriacus]
MLGLTCNACNKEFLDDADQKLHYKSEWHRYNFKRKVAGVPGVTEALFLAGQSALAQEKQKQNETPMFYSCGVCGKDYRSSKAYSQHLKSRPVRNRIVASFTASHLHSLSITFLHLMVINGTFLTRAHIMQASQGTNHPREEKAIIKPLLRLAVNKPLTQPRDRDDEESEDEWEEVDPEEELVGQAANSLCHLNVTEHGAGDQMEEDEEEEELDPCCSFMTHKACSPSLALKVKRDFICLYCNERCHPFASLEAARKHMEARGHCKVHSGDGDEDEEAELEEFYDYSSSDVDESGKQLVAVGDMGNSVELVGGSELVITKRTDGGIISITLGSREYLRYYRQKPRPSPANNMAITTALASRRKFCIDFQVQEYGHSNCAVKGASSENEGYESNE